MIILRKNKGFTLIELLIVIGLLGVVGAILINIIFSTLRGSNKGTIINAVRSDGNYIMQSMVKSLQYANTFEGVSNDFNVPYTKPCPVSPTAYKSVQINTSTFISCPNSSTGDKGSFSSLNSNLSVSSCSISCSQSSGADNPTFVINFTLIQAATGKFSGGLAENTASVSFSTSVRMRNPVQ